MRWELTGKRDMAYSKWHRTLGDDITMIDIDSVEYCDICLEPLALVETAHGWQLNKVADVTRRMAEKLGVPCYIVLYEKGKRDKIVKFKLKQLWPVESGWKTLTPDQMAMFITELHSAHQLKHHARAR